MRRNTRVKNIAQEKQDSIFNKMSADRKLEIGSQLWQLAKSLTGDKINYGRKRSKTSSKGYC